MHQSESKSKCEGCKSKERISVGCPFITCAIKKKGIEFCWDCDENSQCSKWAKHRMIGKQKDSFKCYQKLEDDIAYVGENGIEKFVKSQDLKEKVLIEMLHHFNEGRSKSYYCIAATVMELDELEDAVRRAKHCSENMDNKAKSKVLHQILEEIAEKKKYNLKLRK